MSCEHPLLALNRGKFDGKYSIKILPKRLDMNIQTLEETYGKDNLLMLPCGSCPSCKAAHKRQWAVRCALESSYFKDNCMVTLTYRPERQPKKLIKRDLQKFIKDMRNKGLHFRYFACGEYGESGRCHFHICMFGYWPADAKYEYKNDKGFPVYSSRFIDSVWSNGRISVSEMTPGTAAYVAGYVDKKLGDDEFILMSKKPGIGERYFREHLFDIFHYDNLVGSFGISRVPRYAEKIADYMWYDLDDLKDKRKKAANSQLIQSMLDHGFLHQEDAINHNAQLMRDKLSRRGKRKDL